MQHRRTLILRALVVAVGLCLAAASFRLTQAAEMLIVIGVLFGTLGSGIFAMIVAEDPNHHQSKSLIQHVSFTYGHSSRIYGRLNARG